MMCSRSQPILVRRQWWSEGKSLAHNSCLAPPEGHLCICQASARPPHYLCVTFCCRQGRGKTTAAFFFSPQGIVIVHYISRGERTFLLQKYKYSVSDNTETKCGLRVPAHPRRMSFSKSYPALLCRLIFYSLSTSFHWGRWYKEKLWGWSQHTSPSWMQRYALLQSHTSPTVCYRRIGMWLAEKADGSLNQSQRVCESWQTDCELEEMKLEQKMMHMERPGEWNTG